jgi:CHAT domain-containing protein
MECCSDYVVSSYTPTIAALQRSRRPTIAPASKELSVLVVAESSAPDMPTLETVEEEVQGICESLHQHAVTPIILHSPVKVQDVLCHIHDADIVHLACHGVQDSDALRSGFCLQDGDLTISTLMKQRLDRGLLALLSACETAKGDMQQPDQTVHLAAAMLFAGFRSVVATMW